jgi:hypothetical protein
MQNQKGADAVNESLSFLLTLAAIIHHTQQKQKRRFDESKRLGEN